MSEQVERIQSISYSLPSTERSSEVDSMVEWIRELEALAKADNLFALESLEMIYRLTSERLEALLGSNPPASSTEEQIKSLEEKVAQLDSNPLPGFHRGLSHDTKQKIVRLKNMQSRFGVTDSSTAYFLPETEKQYPLDEFDGA